MSRSRFYPFSSDFDGGGGGGGGGFFPFGGGGGGGGGGLRFLHLGEFCRKRRPWSNLLIQ